MLVIIALAGAVQLLTGAAAKVTTGSGAAHGSTITRFTLKSRFVHRSLAQVSIVPPGGGSGKPLLVFLHGRGGNGPEQNANGSFLAALARLGSLAPDIILPSGGDHSYWHTRKGADWTRYVLDEVIPAAIRRMHADPKRIAIGGISMGGYGAFEIARHRPAEFCAVGGHSAATWMAAGDSAPGAFDDAEDYARHDVVALARAHGRSPWGSAALWLDGGDQDPFHATDAALAKSLSIPLHVWKGAHDGNYWNAHYRDYLRFYAAALVSCR